MDIWTKEKRSIVMSKIRSKNTKPEIILRSALHKQGFRFRIHIKDLPGKPDIVLPKYKTLIFVHGCFWHFHKDCPEGRFPNTNTEYWSEKITRTIERDEQHHKLCKELGWNVLIIWECQIEKKLDEVLRIINESLMNIK
jgi:DNA mismatch endonuclease, patch repair protein